MTNYLDLKFFTVVLTGKSIFSLCVGSNFWFINQNMKLQLVDLLLSPPFNGHLHENCISRKKIFYKKYCHWYQFIANSFRNHQLNGCNVWIRHFNVLYINTISFLKVYFRSFNIIVNIARGHKIQNRLLTRM